jgi:hypothetical protein
MLFSVDRPNSRGIICLDQPLQVLREISHSHPMVDIHLRACDTIRATARNGQIINNVFEYPFDYSKSSANKVTILHKLEWEHMVCDLDTKPTEQVVKSRLEKLVTEKVNNDLVARVRLLAAQIYVVENGASAETMGLGVTQPLTVLVQETLFEYEQPNRIAMALLHANGYRCEIAEDGRIDIHYSGGFLSAKHDLTATA